VKKFFKQLFCGHIYKTISIERIGSGQRPVNCDSHIEIERYVSECVTKECMKCGKIILKQQNWLDI
jgi:hypothetical protein